MQINSGFPEVSNYKYHVFVRTCTYNHSAFIKDCLVGVVNQKTDFPFVHFVIDDASTDGEQSVIETYVNENCNLDKAERYENDICNITIAKNLNNPNCTLVVYFLKKNMYNNPEKEGLWMRWRESCPYEAICEGDDYWISNDKLQRQVEWLDGNGDYLMCCSNGVIDMNGKVINKADFLDPKRVLMDWTKYESDCDIPPHDMIVGGGGFVLTASILYRTKMLDMCPMICKQGKVTDYPLQIWSSIKGKVRYFAEDMVVYRFMATGSWSVRNSKKDLERRINDDKEILQMLLDFDETSDHIYHKEFEQTALNYIYSHICGEQSVSTINEIWKSEIRRLSFMCRLSYKIYVFKILHYKNSYIRKLLNSIR